MKTQRLFAAGAALILSLTAAACDWPGWSPRYPETPVLEVVRISPADHLVGPTGSIGTSRQEGAPRRAVTVMRRQVTEAEYQRCVTDQVCLVRDEPFLVRGDMPVTGVNLRDAEAYASWLSTRTGLPWRLPSESEWIMAAGSRYAEPKPADDGSSQDFVDHWLATYEAEARLAAARDVAPKPQGSFGDNEYGLQDIAGNVWEWTSTCFVRPAPDGAGSEPFKNCNVHAVLGAHRSYQPFFMRDAKGGGCGSGAPPSNLGFRLVMDEN